MALLERLKSSGRQRSAQDSPLFNARKEVVQATKAEMESMKATIIAEVLSSLNIESILERILASEVRNSLAPRKGVDYNDGTPGRDGKDGRHGRDGKDAPLDVIEKMIKMHIPKKGKDKPVDIASMAKDIARALESLPKAEKLDYNKGLKNTPGVDVADAMRKSTGGGAGMGQPQHETKSTSASTTTVSTTYAIAAGGRAIWLYYQGQFLVYGTHYTVGGDRKTITFTFTLENNTSVDITYIRG